MVPRLSRLESLHLSRSIVEDSPTTASFSQCRFPSLKRLSLAVWTMLPEVEQHLALFFQAHPTVESLSWQSRSDGRFIPHSAFPLLHHLVVSWSFDFSIGFLIGRERHSIHLESLTGFNLNDTTLILLHALDPSTLRVLRLQHLQSLQTLRAASRIFPGIIELDLPEDGIEEPDFSLPGLSVAWHKFTGRMDSIRTHVKILLEERGNVRRSFTSGDRASQHIANISKGYFGLEYLLVYRPWTLSFLMPCC
ncbi:hypothetical protein OF83DRAFT_563966 [Amylostereum chailletii]|nr:hypothetical protein OF83DRAFT_563966 [Amylostereum chailletii]